MAHCCHDDIAAIESAVEGERVVPAVWSAGLQLALHEHSAFMAERPVSEVSWTKYACC